MSPLRSFLGARTGRRRSPASVGPAPLVAALVLLLPALAGCLAGQDGPSGPTGDGPDAALPAFTDPLVDEHDHLDVAAHQLRWRMEERSWLPLADDNETARVHALASWGDYLFVEGGLSLTGPAESGLWVLNVSDPDAPEVVGRWTEPSYVSADRSVSVTDDGNWVFLASEGANDAPNSQGIWAVDVSDKTRPRSVAFANLPGGGAHTVEAAIIDGDVYAFALNWGVNAFQLRPALVGDGYDLVPVGKYVDPGVASILAGSDASGQERTTEIVRTLYGHDMDFQVDEETGTPLLYVSYAYQGLHILDVSVPSAPRVLSKWVPGGEGAPWYVHGAQTAFLDGSRTTVVGSEVFENRNEAVASPVWVLDTSDLTDPQLLGTWTNPGDHGSRGLLYSAHFFRIDADAEVLYLSHYHGGVWAVDLSTERARAEPVAVGYFMPANDNGYRPPEDCCGAFDLAGVPMTFDVELASGAVWAADWHTGLYGLRLVDGALPAEEPAEQA